ncbi:MAG TPA: hypothetical protein VED37_20880 [Ktedonobacteraceae bacterium]|nr:hypothetical protein [Ktedonobacteraceae bacterium]
MSVESQVKEVVQGSREWIEDQIEELGKQAKQLQQRSRKQVKLLRKQSRKQIKQLQKQSRQLQKTLRREANKRSRDWTKFLNNTGKYLQDQRESLKVVLAERGGKINQNVMDFGGKTTQNLAERRVDLTQELAKQGQRLLEPVRRRDRTFWSIVGFSVGLVAAGTITYQLIRRRMAQQVIEEDEHIELPPNNSWNGTGGRPMGEISYIDQNGTSVATLEMVDVETTEQPASAAFVGVQSTKLYYPVHTELEPRDLIYFTSEEEAKAQGFSAAE